MHLHLLLPSLFSLFLLSLLLLPPLSLAQLSPSFYATSCPTAISTVTNTINSLSKQDNVVPPSTLRLILHDCFVEGCDGSILISSTPGNKAERDAADNANLPQNSFNAIIAAKKAVEQACPGVVSCADILALAARDAVVFLGGPTWEVPLGRLDGRVSTASSVAGRLPGANFDISQLTDNFASNGLTVQDMVILSGAHTIGFSHCDQFKNRLYSFNSSVNVDPSMDPSFVQLLEKKCPAGGGDNIQEFDILTPFVFDNNYYKDLEAGKGLLFSDQVLFQDASTRSTVQSMAASQQAFFSSFTASMIKMTSTGVKQGANGEIRKDCTAVNAGGGSGNPSAGGAPRPPPIQPAPITLPPSQPAPATPPPSPSAGGTPHLPPIQPAPITLPPSQPAPATPPPSPSAGGTPHLPPIQPAPVTPLPSQPAPATRPPVSLVPPPSPLSPPPPKPVPLVMPPPPTPVPQVSLPPPKPVVPVSSPPAQVLLVSPPPPKSVPIAFPPPQAAPPPPVPTQAPPSPVNFNPPPAPESNPPPAPRGGFTIPGIPGFTPPIHLPFPGFGGGPPPSRSSSSRKTSSKNSRRRL